MHPIISWTEAGTQRSARWRSESGMPPPKRVVIADDTMKAVEAYRLASEGTALLWRGDFQNAKQLLQAMSRRADRKPRKPLTEAISGIAGGVFHLHRQAQSQRARTLAMILIPLDSDYGIPLRRAPDMKLACNEAYGAGNKPSVAALRELLGLIGAHEWRKKGVEIPALGDGAVGARIHPHYGVFSPVRGEYVELVNTAPLPQAFPRPELAFDIGTGTGVLAAVLARRGVKRIVATDQDPRALACARENISRLGLDAQVEVMQADLFPAGKAPLIVCNPPWIPARPSSPIEHAIFDPDSRMLRGFLGGLAQHLVPGGEGWLVLSDIAEHFGLRTREELLALFDASGLQVIERLDIRPHHPKVADFTDPLHAARAAEVTSLWRLATL
ncbi:MAG TPA: class I SAM-dependent methyltransferase [Gallionella sp.]|nr:class I SAM-dependent methyltransferase [Gallionella sp.]